MLQAFATYWNLCIFRGNTAQVPGDNRTLLTLIVILVGLLFVHSLFLVDQEGQWIYFWSFFLMAGCVIGGIVAALRVRSYLNRLRKTVSAYLGTLVILQVFVTLLTLISTANEIAGFLETALGLWRIVIVGFILKHALDVSMILGVVLAFAALVIGVMVVSTVFPVFVQQGA